MAGYISHIIHFAHCERYMESERSQNIMYWVNQNPRYKVNVWTNEDSMRNVISEMDVNIASLIDHDRSLEREAETGKRSAMEPGQSLSFELEHGGTRVAGYGHAGHYRGQVFVRPYSSLPSHNGEKELFADMRLRYGGKTAEDILGLWALAIHGGIYIDNTVAPTGVPLPTYIRAPHDILLARHRLGELDFTTAVIAATKSTKKIGDILRFIDTKYRIPDELGPDDVDVHLIKSSFRKRLQQEALDKVSISVEAAKSMELTETLSVPRPKPKTTLMGRLTKSLTSLVRPTEEQPIVGISANTPPAATGFNRGAFSPPPRPIHDLGEQRAIPELIQDWFEKEEFLDGGILETSQYDISAQCGFRFVFPDYNKRLIPKRVFSRTAREQNKLKQTL